MESVALFIVRVLKIVPRCRALTLTFRTRICYIFLQQAHKEREPSYLYSNQSYWYPQSPITDYATATIQISVPALYSCVASGEVSSDSPELVPAKDPTQARKLYLFTAERPLRYLAFVVTKLTRADRWTVAFDTRCSRMWTPNRSTFSRSVRPVPFATTTERRHVFMTAVSSYTP